MRQQAYPPAFRERTGKSATEMTLGEHAETCQGPFNLGYRNPNELTLPEKRDDPGRTNGNLSMLGRQQTSF